MYAENTVSAVERAVEAGADAVEIDLRRCGSGEVVVIHDETVDRVTDGTGRVSSLGLDTLSSLDVLGTGSGVPTLEDVIEVVGNEVPVNIELKETGLAADAFDVVDRYDAEVLVSSFEPAALREVAQITDAPLALLFAEDATAHLELARDVGCRAVHPHWRLSDEPFVGQAESAGLQVNAWTVRSTATATQLATAGVDGLISDAPAYCPADG